MVVSESTRRHFSAKSLRRLPLLVPGAKEICTMNPKMIFTAVATLGLFYPEQPALAQSNCMEVRGNA